MSITAMKQALEALESGGWRSTGKAITALRTAIEQAEKQEPVAEVVEDDFSKQVVGIGRWLKLPNGTKLYTAPPAAPVQEPVAWTLTEELTKRETTTRGHLWFSDPQNCMWTPLYTTPPAAQRQPLTEQAVMQMARDVGLDLEPTRNMLVEVRGQHAQLVNLARAIEAAHGIGSQL